MALNPIGKTVLLQGKYVGLTYEDVLEKDIHYCKFINEMKFTSIGMKDFQLWLRGGALDAGVKNHIAVELEKMAKRLN